jgi:hypothetical protein
MASTLADPARFFARLRRLTGPLDQGQVGIVNALLAAGALWPPGWLAYALATAWHEARFTPQAEWGRGGAGPTRSRAAMARRNMAGASSS